MSEKTDRLKKIAIEAAERGESQIWECCYALSELVGLYERGQINQLASEMNLSREQVYRRGRAGFERRELGSALDDTPLPDLRFSFYAEMGALRRKYEFSPEYALAQLQTVKETGASVKRMIQIIEEEMAPTIARLEGVIDTARTRLGKAIAGKDWGLAVEVMRILGG